MLVDALVFNGKTIGYISDKGIEWGGNDAEYLEVRAAQVRNVPVKTIKVKDATNELKFTLIELLPQNCADVMGGTVQGTKWLAPTTSVNLTGDFSIRTGTGQTIAMGNATLDGAIRGTIGGNEPLGINCTVKIDLPADGSEPFSIDLTTPFIKATPTALSFVKGGESKMLSIDASGAFTMGNVPAGFTATLKGGRITVTASANSTTSQRTGNLVFTLADNPSKTVTVTLTQAG